MKLSAALVNLLLTSQIPCVEDRLKLLTGLIVRVFSFFKFDFRSSCLEELSPDLNTHEFCEDQWIRTSLPFLLAQLPYKANCFYRFAGESVLPGVINQFPGELVGDVRETAVIKLFFHLFLPSTSIIFIVDELGLSLSEDLRSALPGKHNESCEVQ